MVPRPLTVSGKLRLVVFKVTEKGAVKIFRSPECHVLGSAFKRGCIAIAGVKGKMVYTLQHRGSKGRRPFLQPLLCLVLRCFPNLFECRNIKTFSHNHIVKASCRYDFLCCHSAIISHIQLKEASQE